MYTFCTQLNHILLYRLDIRKQHIKLHMHDHTNRYVSDNTTSHKWNSRWLGPDIAPNLAVQKLSHAIKTMNDVLLPWCLSHKCITSAILNRRLDVGVPRSNEDGDGDGGGDGATRIDRNSGTGSSGSSSYLTVNAELKANTALRGRSSSSVAVPAPIPVHDHGSAPATNSNNNNNNNNNSVPMQIDLTSTSLSHRFESWMTFMEITSELLAKVVTPAFICDSFLSAKMTPDNNHRSGAVPYKNQNLDLILNLDPDQVLSSNIIQPSSFSGGDVEDEQFLARPRKKARNSVTGTGASVTMSTNMGTSEKKEKDDVVCDEVNESTGHNGAARHFLRGVMSLEEAATVEEAHEGLRRRKESALQTLIKDFYSYSNPNTLQGSDVAVRTSTSSVENSLDKVTDEMLLYLTYHA